MKIKLTKQAIQNLKVVLFLLAMLVVVLFLQNLTRSKGKTAIENFLQTMGANK